jgi:hypothetical protein
LLSEEEGAIELNGEEEGSGFFASAQLSKQNIDLLRKYALLGPVAAFVCRLRGRKLGAGSVVTF